MRSADYPALRNLALEEEKTILQEIEKSEKVRIRDTIISVLLWAAAVWALSFSEIASLIVYIVALVFTVRASHSGVSELSRRLSTVSRLIGMEHYSSVIHRFPRAANAHEFIQKIASLEKQGIPYKELVKSEDDRQN